MSAHNKIRVKDDSNRPYTTGKITDTSKPGTIMEVVPATEPVGTIYSWRAATPASSGDQILIAVLCENHPLGKTVDDAYVANEQGLLYIPQPGDMLQVLLENQAGTSDSFAIGDKLMVKTNGKIIATSGTPEAEPFVVMETLAALTADTLCLVYFTGY